MGVLATDNFANLTNWTALPSHSLFDLGTNYVYSTTGGKAGYYSGYSPWPNDQYCKFTFPVAGTVTDEGGGPVCRADASATTFYLCQCNTVETKFYACVTGTYHLLATGAAIADNDTVEFRVTGSNPVELAAYLNGSGTAFLTHSDTTYLITSGNVGGRISASGGGQLSAFEGGSVVGATVTFTGLVDGSGNLLASTTLYWSWFPGATKRIGALGATPEEGSGATDASGDITITPTTAGQGIMILGYRPGAISADQVRVEQVTVA
jgi:hypothetical protein